MRELEEAPEQRILKNRVYAPFGVRDKAGRLIFSVTEDRVVAVLNEGVEVLRLAARDDGGYLGVNSTEKPTLRVGAGGLAVSQTGEES